MNSIDSGPHSPIARDQMSAWMWIALPLASIGTFSVWGGLLGMIVARQVATIIPDPHQSAGILGTVLGVGAFVILCAQPILGSLSDTTSSNRLGRRNSWILFGGILGALCLLAMAFNHSIVLLPILLCLTVIPVSAAHVALSTVLPERVPLELQGKMSGLNGSMGILGYLIGVSVSGLSSSTMVGYIALSAILVSTTTLFALTTREPPPLLPDSARSANVLARISALWLDIPSFSKHRDFWFAFLSRFAILLGYYIVVGMNLLIMMDFIGFSSGNVDHASNMLAKILSISMILNFGTSLLTGFLSDMVGRIRIFVIVPALLLIPIAATLGILPNMPGFIAAQLLLGAVSGGYIAVDNVLVARVLPKTGNAARDLGLLNIANSGPQALGPALAGAIVAMTENYYLLFIAMALLGLCSALAAYKIRSVP